MNLQNFYLLPNADVVGDYFVFGDITDDGGNLLGTFGPDGTSLFAWWVQQPSDWQLGYVMQFSSIMAQQIVIQDGG
jgi:hypothetical protein